MHKPRRKTLRTTAVLLAAALVLGATVAVAQGTLVRPSPSDQNTPACDAGMTHANDTAVAHSRCRDARFGHDASCDRAARAHDDAAVHGRCADVRGEHDAKRCARIARTDANNTTANTTTRRHCGERFHGNATLGVLVTKPSRHGPQPAAGALVTAYKVERDHEGYDATPVARAETGEHGHAKFRLPQGYYLLRAREGDLGGFARVKLDDDARVHIHLGDASHDRPGPYNLGLAVYERGDDGEPQPVPGAHVVIARLTRDNATGNATWEPIERGTTDAHGQYTTALPKGAYAVKVTGPDGEKEGHKRFFLRTDKWVRVGIVQHEEDGPRIQPVSGAAAERSDDEVIVVDANATSV